MNMVHFVHLLDRVKHLTCKALYLLIVPFSIILVLLKVLNDRLLQIVHDEEASCVHCIVHVVPNRHWQCL